MLAKKFILKMIVIYPFWMNFLGVGFSGDLI